jgi:hypothetical protein
VIRAFEEAQMPSYDKHMRNPEEADALGSLNPVLVMLYLLAVAFAASGLFGFR